MKYRMTFEAIDDSGECVQRHMQFSDDFGSESEAIIGEMAGSLIAAYAGPRSGIDLDAVMQHAAWAAGVSEDRPKI